MAEKLGVKIRIEPGTSERELAKKIRDKYKNINLDIDIDASAGNSRKTFKNIRQSVKDINTEMAKVIAAYGRLDKLQNKIGSKSFLSLSGQLRPGADALKNQSGNVLEYIMSLQTQLDNLSADELAILLKEIQNAEKILKPAVDTIHKQQKESIALHDRQKKAQQDAAKAAQKAADDEAKASEKAQKAREKAIKAAEKEREEIVKTKQAIHLKLDAIESAKKGVTAEQWANIQSIDSYASGASDADELSWLLNNLDNPDMGMGLHDYKLILNDVNKEYSNIIRQIKRMNKEAAQAAKIAAADQKETEEKEKNLQDILVLQQQLTKLMQKSKGSGISLDLDNYKSGGKETADLLRTDLSSLDGQQLADLKADLSTTLAQGNAKYSAYSSRANAATQLENLNHQITEYIKNNSKIKSNRGLYAELYRLHQQIKSGNINVEEAQKKFAELQSQFASLKLETMSLSSRLIKLFKDHLNTAIAMAGLHALQNSLRNMLTAVIDIDTAMTELRKVTNETDIAYEKFLDRAIDKATVLGAKVSDVVTATADFARLGFSMGEAEQLADAAIIYKNVGDGIEDISVASQSIISTMKAFGYSAQDAMSIVNKFNYVGNNFAVTSADLGEALQRSASAMAQGNNTLEESIALITAGNRVVQNADVVGTALKTLSLRLNTTKVELEELGEDTTGAAESTSEYRDEILAITSAAGRAVDILDETGNSYKSTYRILQELSGVWDNISQKEQQSLMYLLGGARQANTLGSILQNFADAEKVVKDLSAGLANNSALEENERYLDSINGKLEQFNALFQALSENIVDSDAVKGLLDAANGFLRIADGLIEITDVMPLAIAGFTGLMAAGEKTFFRPGFFNEGESFINSLKNFKGIKDISLYGLNFDRGAQGGAISDFGRYVGRKNVTKLKSVKNRYKTMYEPLLDADLNKEVDRIIQEHGNNLDEMSAKLINLGDSIQEVPTKLSAFKKELIAFGKRAGIMLAVSLAIKGVAMAIDAAVVTAEERKEKINEYSSALENVTSELEQLRELEGSGKALTAREQARLDYLEDYKESLRQRLALEQKLYNRQELAEGDWNPLTKNTYEQVQTALDSNNAKFLSSYADWVPGVTNVENKAMYAARAEEFRNGIIQEQALLEQQKASVTAAMAAEDNIIWQQKYKMQLEDIERQIEINKRAIDKANKAGLFSLEIVSDTKEKAEELASIDTWNLFNTADGARSTTISTINSELDEMQSAFSTLIAAKQEYDAYQSYSLDTLQALANLDSKYLNLLIDEQGRLELNAEAMNNLAQARINEFRIKIMTDAAQQIQNLIDTGNATAWLAQQQADLNVETYEGAKATLALAAGQAMLMGGDMATAAQMIMNQANALLNAVGAWDGYGAAGSAALNKVNDAAEKARKEAEDNLRKQGEAALAALDKKKDALQDELDALEEVYDAEDREFELQKRINAYQRAQAAKTVRLYTHDKGWQWVADPTKVKEAQDAVEEYQKEIRREDAKKAIQDQIDAIDDLRDKVQEAMNAIGNDYINNRDNLALMAQLEGMTLDQLGGWINNYATNVINANANVAASYDTAAAHAAAYFKTIKEQTVNPASVRPVDGAALADIVRAQKIQNSYTATDAMNGDPDFWIGRYHTGGLVRGVSPTANVSSQFLKYMNKLQSDEVPAILKAGEYVLTKQHQADILNDRANLINSVKTGGTTTLSIGDIVINQPVGSVESLSLAIVQKLPNQIMKDLYSK